MQPILFSLIAVISTFIGGLVSLRYKKYIHEIMSLTAGVLIGVVFFDIVPEIVELAGEHNLDLTYSLLALVGGFLAIHILEKYAAIHSSHEGEYASHHHPHVGIVSTLGLIFHSMLDGVGIGLGFQVDAHVGLLVAVAVIAHDFSDGLNTVSLMLINKNSTRKALAFLVLDALAPILGVALTYFFTIPAHLLSVYLGFFAGFLLYLGAADLLPEAHSKHSSWRMIGLTILGLGFIFGVTRFT